MKGFTLIETLVYMAVTSFLFLSLTTLFFTAIDSRFSSHQTVSAELAGVYWLKTLEHDIRALSSTTPDTSNDPDPISDITLASSTHTTTSVSFSIRKTEFTSSFFAP